MIPDGSIHDVQDTDLVVVTSIIDIDQTLRLQGEVIDWLKDRYGRGSHIATICTGAFVLAETGLLDGKTATTHWCHTTKFQKDHHDKQILTVQNWIEDKYDKKFSYAELAHHHGMSRRTLERRFKAATGDTPLTYQQRIRVERAKHMLEDGRRSFDEITYQVGYEDSSTFRKVFIKQAGLRPTEYRNKFQRI